MHSQGRTAAGVVALVTGASSGIGRATAILLAERGAAVAVNYRANDAGAQETVEEIEARGGRAIAVQADVSSADDVERMVSVTTGALGPIDILVNNAGTLIKRQPILGMSLELWNETLAVNLTSAFLCCQAVAPAMIERRVGAIVNVSSVAGRNGGGPGATAYAAAKAGVIAFTKGLARELAPHGVRVNAVAPGVIDTRYHEVFTSPDALAGMLGTVPLGRPGSSEEVAEAIAFLGLAHSSYITGETIEINGGMAMY